MDLDLQLSWVMMIILFSFNQVQNSMTPEYYYIQ